jgi:hypothetical protein
MSRELGAFDFKDSSKLMAAVAKNKEWSLDLHRAELTTATPGAPLPMNAIWRTIRGYVLWQHERGTLHYDIMVTLILIFVVFSPRVIKFNDKPIPRDSHPSEVTVKTDAEGNLSFEIAASAISAAGDEQAMREQLLHIIEPISGAVSIVRYDAIYDRKGKVQSYKVVARRE